MRLYSITNMYMHGIHSGIQTQHSTVKLFVKYDKSRGDSFPQEDLLYDWAYEHETTVVLNGGDHAALVSLLDLFNYWETENYKKVLPFAPFFEPGINYALTSISVIIPQTAIDFMSSLRSTKPGTLEFEALKLDIVSEYETRGYEILSKIAFLPLAK